MFLIDYEELKPCPFCGKSKTLFVDHDEYYGHDDFYYVVCCISDYGCGTTGPAASSEQAAIVEWNRRADNE